MEQIFILRNFLSLRSEIPMDTKVLQNPGMKSFPVFFPLLIQYVSQVSIKIAENAQLVQSCNILHFRVRRQTQLTTKPWVANEVLRSIGASGDGLCPCVTPPCTLRARLSSKCNQCPNAPLALLSQMGATYFRCKCLKFRIPPPRFTNVCHSSIGIEQYK